MKCSVRGATLTEVIISLAVVGVLTALGLPALTRTLPNYRLASAARNLLFSIQEAKARAVYRRIVCYLDFDLDVDGDVNSEGCMLWEDDNGNRHKEDNEKSEGVLDLVHFPGVHYQAFPSELGGPERGPNNTKIDAGGGDGISFSQNRIKFNPNGTSSTGTIYLHNRNGRTFAIRLRHNGYAQTWYHDGYGWVRK